MQEDQNIVKKIKLGLYEIILKDDGILYVYVSDEREQTIADIKLAVNATGEILNYKKAPIFYKLAEFVTPNQEIRNYWAQEDSNPYCTAECYIIHNLALRIIGNFYLNFDKPSRPTKLFTNEKEAIDWLKTFL